jgi:2-polyprenyl-3-methyl-5-hydroxy-6-metoxy-1,4-benzoquinol methylase
MDADPPSCLLCTGAAGGIAFPFGTRWNGRDFDYLRCARCGASFLDPIPGPRDFERMYSQSTYHDNFYEGLEEPTPSRLDDVAPQLPRGGTLLDFGCGNGAFMVAAQAAGFACEGVELDPGTRARAAANSGRPIRTLEEVRGRGSRYDIVHLGDVLEHLPRPAETMRDLASLLTERGLFFVEGPLEDNASLVYYASRAFGGAKRLLGRPLRGTFPPYHLFRASARAQRRFFTQRLGWQVKAFRVYETGWPYLLPDDRLLRPRSPGRAARMVIGGAAVAFAAAAALLRARVGNRFAALVVPQ